MLNISHNQVNKKVSLEQFESGRRVSGRKYYKYINRFLQIFSVILLIVLFAAHRIQGAVYTACVVIGMHA